ncbi:MAG: hypothetical protein EOP05_15575 [Proteobacteria bacterium]|nr:MAG: hypothetical protein EOP05_15575 [Pseudomonadota bacterium]
MKAFARTALVLTLAASAASALPGCTSEEIAATALVIGAVAIVSDGDVSAPVREHRNDRRDHRGWDRGPRGDGPRHDGPRGDGPRGPRGDRGFAATESTAQFAGLLKSAPKFQSKDARVINLANNYEVSHYAATYLVRAIVLAEAKDASGVKDLGLELKDFRDLYQGKELADSKVQKLGAKLRLSESETARLVSDMSEDVQIEKAVRGL